MRKYIIENLEGEIWIKNNGYEISNMGRIIGKNGKLLSCKVGKDGYVPCSIKFEDGFYASSYHRAVAYLFVPNDDPINKIEVNHKDGIKHHNYDNNLEWVTKKENQQHEARVLQQRNGENNSIHRMTDEMVKEIYNLCLEGKMLYKDIAVMYDLPLSHPSFIATGRLWKHLGLRPFIRVRGSRKYGRQGEIKYLDELQYI